MMRTALISVALAIVGVGLLLLVASTAGPPDGYQRFSERNVHVYLPDDFQVRARNEPDVVASASDGRGSAIEVTDVPAHGRSLDAFVRTARREIERRGGDITGDDAVDVGGADDARELTIRYPDIDFDTTRVVARLDDRFYTLIVADATRRGPDLDNATIADSFYLD
jgi:hypothetical protein